MPEESALHEVSDIVDAPNDRAVRTLISEWRAADLIPSEQADALTAYHREHHLDEERSRGFGRTIAVVSSLGALLVGAGNLLVVSSNSFPVGRIASPSAFWRRDNRSATPMPNLRSRGRAGGIRRGGRRRGSRARRFPR